VVATQLSEEVRLVCPQQAHSFLNTLTSAPQSSIFSYQFAPPFAVLAGLAAAAVPFVLVVLRAFNEFLLV
jgi:hypothetical protein